LILIGLIALAAHVDGSEPYVVDFSNDDTLKPVFDSGLRPRNLRGIERITCSIESVNDVAFRIWGKTVPIRARSIKFDVDGNDQLVSVIAYGKDKFTVDEAFDVMRKFQQMIGVPEAPLRAFIEQVKRSRYYMGDGYGIATELKKPPVLGISLQPSFDKSTPLSLMVAIDWKRRIRKSPIRKNSNHRASRL
jgi:hypothetical protein